MYIATISYELKDTFLTILVNCLPLPKAEQTACFLAHPPPPKVQLLLFDSFFAKKLQTLVCRTEDTHLTVLSLPGAELIVKQTLTCYL